MQFLEDRRTQVLAKLDMVNKYRNDAHAKAIDAEQMNAVRSAFDYLEVIFSEP